MLMADDKRRAVHDLLDRNDSGAGLDVDLDPWYRPIDQDRRILTADLRW